LIGEEAPPEGPLLTLFFNRTQARCRLRWVERGRPFLEQRLRELELQRQGALDPATLITDALLDPTVRLEGEFESDGRSVSGELRLVDIATGRVIVRRQFRGRSRKFQRLFSQWALERHSQASRRLAEREAVEPPLGCFATSTRATGRLPWW
jgi:hypothetical protein